MDLHVYRNSQDRWHDLRKRAATRGAALASNAVTLEELAQRITRDLTVTTAGQRLALTRVAARGGLPVRYAVDALAELKGAAVTPSEAGSSGLETVATILEAYEALLAKHRLSDPSDVFWTAASRVKEKHPATAWLDRFESIVLHTLYDLNDAQYTLLHHVIERLPGGGTVVLFNATANVKPTQFAEWTWRRFVQAEELADKTYPEFVRSSGPLRSLLERLFVFEAGATAPTRLGPDESLRVIQCSGRYGEVEAIGSEIADLLARGEPADEIAVVVRHVDAYGEMIEDVFMRYGIPHVFSTGVPLLRIPFIKYWIALLDLVSGERHRDALARVMASAYYQPRLTPNMDPEAMLARIGYIDRRHLKASALALRHQPELAPELERLETLLDKIEGASWRAIDFLEQLQPPAVLTERDRQAWRILSDELQAVDPLLGTIDFTAFRQLASDIAGARTIDRFSGKPITPGLPAVRVLGPHALGHRSYEWIFSPGFVDGEIPSPALKNPLLPDDAIDRLNRRIRPRRLMNSRDRNRREPLQLFMLLDSASRSVMLTFPGASLEGDPIYPSIYLGEIQRHYDPRPLEHAVSAGPRDPGAFLRHAARAWRNDVISEAQAAELLGAGIVRRAREQSRGIERADLGAGVLPLDVEWSPSELNSLASCPFVFLARHRLKIRPIDLPDFEVPAIDVGSLAHDILREFYSTPIPERETEAGARMQQIIERRLAPVDTSGQGPNSVIDPSLWKIRRPQLVRALMEYVKFAIRDARDGFETLPEYLDQRLPPARLGEVLVGGRADHIATKRVGGQLVGIRVDDFKYSVSSSLLNRQLQQSFQIPLYAHLAASTLNADSTIPMEGRYLLLRSPSTPVVACSIDAATLSEVRERVEGLMEKVRAGRLHPDPADSQECTLCDYRRLCRKYGG